MALHTPQTIPSSAHPTPFTNTHQTDNTVLASTTTIGMSSQAKPTMGNKCRPAHEMLKQQWQKEAVAEFEATAAPYFTVNKSPLCKPGTAPSLIVIGDGHHALPEVQNRLTTLVKFLEKNGAMTTLVVEYAHPPSRRECRGVPSESTQTPRKTIRCVGGDHIESTHKVEQHIQMMWQAAFDLANEIYQFAKTHGAEAEHLNPNILMRGVYPLNYADILDLYSKKIFPYYASLESAIKADESANLKISDRLMDYSVAYGEFSGAVGETTYARDAHLMQTLDVQIKSGQTVVAVFGDAHVQYNAEVLLKNYDCWVLDDKSSNYTFPRPSES